MLVRRMPLLLALGVSCVALACGAFSGSDEAPPSEPPAGAPDGAAPADALAPPPDDAAAADASPDAATPPCPYASFPPTGSAYRAAVLADCPKAYFPMDEVAGSTAAASAVDQKVTPINGGSSPGYTFGVPGFVGTAIDFTAKNEGFAYPFEVVKGTQFTVEAWVRPKTNVGTMPVFLDADATGAGFTLNLKPGASSLTAELDVKAGSAVIAAIVTKSVVAGPAQDLGWHHVAAVADATSYRVYLDGMEDTVASTIPLTKTDQPLAFGNFFTGSFDEVAIYDRPLSRARIAAHAASAP